MRRNGWHVANRDAQNVALFLGVALAFVLRFWLKVPLLMTAVFAVFLGLLVYELYGRRRRVVSRFFSIAMPEAQTAVTEMLQSKGIPFKQQGDRFILTEDDLIVRVTRFRTTRSGKKGTYVSLQPLSEASWPLLESLQNKIDDAFPGQGL